jgi:hypothetical protein
MSQNNRETWPVLSEKEGLQGTDCFPTSFTRKLVFTAKESYRPKKGKYLGGWGEGRRELLTLPKSLFFFVCFKVNFLMIKWSLYHKTTVNL